MRRILNHRQPGGVRQGRRYAYKILLCLSCGDGWEELDPDDKPECIYCQSYNVVEPDEV